MVSNGGPFYKLVEKTKYLMHLLDIGNLSQPECPDESTFLVP